MNYIQQAYKGHNHFWRYLITTFIVMSPFLLNIAIYFALPELFEASMEEMENFDGNKNFFLLMNLAPFAVLLVFLFLFVKFLHERSIRSLTTSRAKIDWKRVFYAFGLWFSLSVAFLVISYLIAPENMVWNFKPIPFFLLVGISLIFIPLQTSLEEYLFRGYLMQGLGILAKNRWVPLLITSLAFGLLHSFNPEVEKLGWGVMVFYIGTGLFFGVATLMDEGLELALGLFFLMRFKIGLALAATIVILGITTFGVTKTLLDKKSIRCACLGTALKLPMTEATFIENAIMLVMAFVMLFQLV